MKLSELSDYSGIDASNIISLFEYGLLIKEDSESIHCYYQESNEGEFGAGHLDKKDVDNIINESWFNKESFLSYLGMDENEWLNCGYAMKIHDLISFYGIDNIFGCPYYNIVKITNE